MPEMDGVEATRRIRDRAPEIRVVMLTMHADQDVIAAAIRAGAVGYLVKDCSFEEVADDGPPWPCRPTPTSRRSSPPPCSPRRADLGRPTATRVVTKREIEVLQLIADGCSTPEVAEQLYISQKTVKNHLASIYAKLDARDRTQAVLQAVRMGIVRLY